MLQVGTGHSMLPLTILFTSHYFLSAAVQLELRLANGPHSCAGSVQIYHGNEWHTVCYDGWGMEEAAVVCRYLGCGSAVSTPWTTQYGEGTGSIMLDDVNCAGSELSLKQCPSSGWKLHNCANWQVAGVHCEVGLRLVNGPHSCAGRVEIYHDNEWGTVCGDHWGMKEAEVVCRELGCGNAIKASVRDLYGEGTGPIMLDDVNCAGSESSVKQCPSSGWKVHNCDHRKDAGVQCGVAVRLANGPHACAGRVEIYHGNEWGTVCDYNWGMEEAAVVCKELGCGDPVSAPGTAHYGQGTGPVWLDNVSCKGFESSLKQCPTMGWKKQNCHHTEDAGVQCKMAIRLRNGPNPCTGRVEVYHGNEWGTVCDDNWGMEEAAVACRELGCGDAISAPGTAHYGQGTGSIILNDVNCVGSESSLKQCSSMGWKNQICGHWKDAGVQCKVVIRLVNGPNPCAGRVEVYHDNVWGTVCDDYWGMEEAAVVCRELGCGDAVSAPGAAHYGRGTGPIMLGDVNCEGSESSLNQCSFKGWKNQLCGHWKDAGVHCKEPSVDIRTTTTMMITTTAKPVAIQIPPQGVIPIGSKITIKCSSGYHELRYCDLFKNGYIVLRMSNSSKIFEHVIENIAMKDDGYYKCKCYRSNDAYIESDNVTLIVKEQVEEPEIRMNENKTEIVCSSKNSSYNYQMCILYRDGHHIQDTIIRDVDHASFDITDLPAGSSFSCLCYEHNLKTWTRSSSVITKG